MKRNSEKKEMEAIACMIGHRLKTYVEIETTDVHPDDDTICAFVEGRLEEAGSSKVVSHLISCRTCRQITAQLSRLTPEFPDESVPADEASTELPSMLSELASRLIPQSGGDAVFAYQDPTETGDESQTEPAEQPEKTESE